MRRFTLATAEDVGHPEVTSKWLHKGVAPAWSPSVYWRSVYDKAGRAPVAHLDKGPVITELLSRGSQVRILPGALLASRENAPCTLREAPRLAPARRERFRALPGAPFPKEFADFFQQEILRRSFIEKSDRSLEFAPELRECVIDGFRSAISRGGFSAHRREPSRMSLITGHECRRSGDSRCEWHGVRSMYELRDLRRATGLGQREFVALLGVALEPFDGGIAGDEPYPHWCSSGLDLRSRITHD